MASANASAHTHVSQRIIFSLIFAYSKTQYKQNVHIRIGFVWLFCLAQFLRAVYCLTGADCLYVCKCMQDALHRQWWAICAGCSVATIPLIRRKLFSIFYFLFRFHSVQKHNGIRRNMVRSFATNWLQLRWWLLCSSYLTVLFYLFSKNVCFWGRLTATSSSTGGDGSGPLSSTQFHEIGSAKNGPNEFLCVQHTKIHNRTESDDEMIK